MANDSKITLAQLITAMNKSKTYTDDEISAVTGNAKVEPEELDMPKIFIYGDALPTSKTDVLLTMDYISSTAKFSSYIKLKCQGTSSMSYSKKNFTIKMYSDEERLTKLKKDFKGWGKQNQFCLKANYVDTTHTRNLSGARIGYDMVASRPDSDFKTNLLTAPRYGLVDGFPIKLYFNGEFYGIYTWNIPKGDWQFNMDEDNPNHCVLCAEVNTNGTYAENACNFRKLWGGNSNWSVEVGTASTEIIASFDRCINFVMTATDEEFKTNIGEYFDLYSLLDYYCFSYLTTHLDGLAKNMLMATYDGVIWGASLYDMDSIYGANWQGSAYHSTSYQCPEEYQEQFSLLWERIEANFGAELYARYLELRQGALSLSNIVKHVEEIYDVIPDRVFADEQAKWTSLPGVSTNTMTRFRNYMRDRAVYVDAEMLEIGTEVNCTGIVLSNDTLEFTTTDTQTLSVVVSPENCTDKVVWSVEPSGIVSIDNGVITPVANGECTITVTCGSYSDTCTVTVSLLTVECTSISLDKTELSLGVIEDSDESANTVTKLTEQLTATVEPSNTTDVITWASSLDSIATVNDGLVTAVGNGNATITATCGSQSATCTVTVSGMSESDVDYSDVDYIESTGTQYIDTGIIPTTSTKIEFVADISPTKQYDQLFGSDDFVKLQWQDGTGTSIRVCKKKATSTINGFTLGKHTYVMDMADTTHVITVDETDYGSNIGTTETTSYSLLLLSGYSIKGTVETEYCAIGKIYSCKIYEDDTLVRDMKPVLTSDGIYGLLDTVNNKFYDSMVDSFTGGTV